MTDELKQFTINFIHQKEEENPEYIRYSFFELNVKYDCSKKEIDEILEMSKNYFENKGYNVYFEGAKFEYQNARRMVQSNELMVAIKEN